MRPQGSKKRERGPQLTDSSTLWREWGLLTRFLESARLAFARERSLWHSLELHNRSAVKISAPTGPGHYKVPLDAHISVMDDEETLYASVLIHSYALAEAAARSHIGLTPRQASGIEEWGTRLLAAQGRSWADGVLDGHAGAVEVAVVRNAFAHGTRVIDEHAARRLQKAGAPERVLGDAVNLSYQELRLFRERLRSLLNTGGLELRSQTT